MMFILREAFLMFGDFAQLSPSKYYILSDAVIKLTVRDINVERAYENLNLKEDDKLPFIRKWGNEKKILHLENITYNIYIKRVLHYS